MRIISSLSLSLAVLLLLASGAQAQTATNIEGQYRPYPGGNIAYYNPGQVYPPPGSTGAATPVYPAGSSIQAGQTPQPTLNAGAQSQVYTHTSAPTKQTQLYESFQPGVTIGALNPYTNYVGDMGWKLFAQRTASFGPAVVSPIAPAPVAPVASSQYKSKPKSKPKAKPAAKPKPKPAPKPAAETPKRPMNDVELEQFCLEYVELCKDYFK